MPLSNFVPRGITIRHCFVAAEAAANAPPAIHLAEARRGVPTKRLRIVTLVRGFGWEIAHGAVSRRPPISLYTKAPRPGTGGYAYDVGVWDVSIISLSPRAKPSRHTIHTFFSIAVCRVVDDEEHPYLNARFLLARVHQVRASL